MNSPIFTTGDRYSFFFTERKRNRDEKWRERDWATEIEKREKFYKKSQVVFLLHFSVSSCQTKKKNERPLFFLPSLPTKSYSLQFFTLSSFLSSWGKQDSTVSIGGAWEAGSSGPSGFVFVFFSFFQKRRASPCVASIFFTQTKKNPPSQPTTTAPSSPSASSSFSLPPVPPQTPRRPPLRLLLPPRVPPSSSAYAPTPPYRASSPSSRASATGVPSATTEEEEEEADEEEQEEERLGETPSA